MDRQTAAGEGASVRELLQIAELACVNLLTTAIRMGYNKRVTTAVEGVLGC